MTISTATQKLTLEGSLKTKIATETLKRRQLHNCYNFDVIKSAVKELKKEMLHIEAALLVEMLLRANKNTHSDVYFTLLSLYKAIDTKYAIELAKHMLQFSKTNTKKIKLHGQLNKLYKEDNDYLSAATHAVLKLASEAEPAMTELREYNMYLKYMNELEHSNRINPSKESINVRNVELQIKVNRVLNIKQITKTIQSLCVKLGLKRFVHVISEQIHDHLTVEKNICEKSVSRILVNYIENQKKAS